MSFHQLNAIIPVLEHADTFQVASRIDSAPDAHRLLIVLRGHVTVTAREGMPVIVGQGYACHPLHGPFEIDVPRTKEAEYMLIRYRLLPEDAAWSLAGPLRTISEVKIKYMADELARTLSDVHPHSEAEIAAQQFRKRLMLERMLFIYMYETSLAGEKKSAAAAIDETLSYMNEHYMLKLTLPMLAQRAGMSEGHFTVLFKQQTGQTMTRYLRKLRIEKAKEMFRQTTLPAKDIAQRTGFIDYFHFSRTFKLEVGRSPAEFQREWIENLKI